MKLGKVIIESNWYEEDKGVSDETRTKFFEAVRDYNTLGKAIYREGNLLEVAKTLLGISKTAETFTLQEAGDWFDRVTVQRNMKDLRGLGSQFAKFATEAQQLQDRMSALYEDMGHILNRYYSIDEIQDELENGHQERNQLKNEYEPSHMETDQYDDEDHVEIEARRDYDDDDDEEDAAIDSARNLEKIKRQKRRGKVSFKKRTNNESIPHKLNLTLGEAGFDEDRMDQAIANDKWMRIQLRTKYDGDKKRLWQQVGYGD